MGNSNPKYGYICVYTNEYYDQYNLCTFGKVINLDLVKNKYNNFEVKKGDYVLILKVPYNILDTTIGKLITTFTMIGHKKITDGNIYYDKKIINLIHTYLNNINVKYEDYTNDITDLIDYYVKLPNV